MLTTGLNIMQQARLKSLMKENGDDTTAEAIAGYEHALGCAPGVLQPFLFPEEADDTEADSAETKSLAEANDKVAELQKALTDANEAYGNALEEAQGQIQTLTNDNLAHSNAAVDAKTSYDKSLADSKALADEANAKADELAKDLSVANSKIVDLEAKLKEKAVVKK